jgi:hypothetical protein
LQPNLIKSYLEFAIVGLAVPFHLVNCALSEAQLGADAPHASLQLKLAGFEVVWRRHVHHVAVSVLQKQADQGCVHEPTVDSDLILDEFDEGVPNFDDLGRVLSHEALRIVASFELLGCSTVVHLLGDHDGLLGHVRSHLSDQFFFC